MKINFFELFLIGVLVYLALADDQKARLKERLKTGVEKTFRGGSNSDSHHAKIRDVTPPEA